MAMPGKIYVGCALTSATKPFTEEIVAFKDLLRIHSTVLDFLGLVEGTPVDVYRHDIEVCVAGCDMFTAVCDEHSIGRSGHS